MIDDKTLIYIDGDRACTWGEFLRDNDFEPEEISEIRNSLITRGEYHGGGGAAAEFVVRLKTMTACTFIFDVDPDIRYEGFADGTTWNGFDNVAVTPETLATIAENFRKCDPEFDPENWEIPPGPNGLCSLAYGFATQIVESK